MIIAMKIEREGEIRFVNIALYLATQGVHIFIFLGLGKERAYCFMLRVKITKGRE